MEKSFIYNGVETDYVVYDDGHIFSKLTNRFLKFDQERVTLRIEGKPKAFLVGRIVGVTFLPDYTPNCLIGHKDGDKKNNNINNLFCMSNSENVQRTWEKRRENGTISIKYNGQRRKNIVEKQYLPLEDNEKIFMYNNIPTNYGVTVEGRVRNLLSGKILQGSLWNGYRYYNLHFSGEQHSIAGHRIVALTFLPNPEDKPYVDHIDGNRRNNSLSNLRWVSAKENANNLHSYTKRTAIENEPTVIEGEEWREILGIQVSNFGRVITKKGQLYYGAVREDGYKSVQIETKKYLVHVLVWEAFMGKKPAKSVINHKNGIKSDNRLENLELCSHQENMLKASIETNAWGFSRVGEFDKEGKLLYIAPNATQMAKRIGILPGSLRNTIRRNGRCSNGLYYKYLDK